MFFKDLLAILRDEEPYGELGGGFREMLRLVEPMFRDVNVALWSEQHSPEISRLTYTRDVQINKLERAVRKEVLNHLAVRTHSERDIPYCFVLINVVKDAERIGDYTKNLCELTDLGPLPEGDIKKELREVGVAAESYLSRLGPAFESSEVAEATALVRRGRDLSKRAEALVRQIASAGFDSRATVKMTLMARFYKRIIGHAVNILSSVIMPLHKIDYFDEEELAKQ